MNTNRHLSLMLMLCLSTAALPARKTQTTAAVYRATPDTSLLQRPFGNADRGTFLRPDHIFYPETWFHFVNGNVRREGITRDLEAIAQSGIQGVQLFHGRIGSPNNWPGTEEPIECLTPKWEDLVQHTASEAHRMGLRFSLQTCPGWAMSGGPWIKPEQAMRHISYTRTDIDGGAPADQTLELPKMEEWRDWRDICVLAFPTPKGDTGGYCQVEAVEAPSHQQDWQRLLSQERGFNFQLAPTTPGKPYRVSFRLKGAATMRSIEFNPIDVSPRFELAEIYKLIRNKKKVQRVIADDFRQFFDKVRKLNLPHIRLLADAYHMFMEKD